MIYVLLCCTGVLLAHFVCCINTHIMKYSECLLLHWVIVNMRIDTPIMNSIWIILESTIFFSIDEFNLNY